MLNVVMDVNGTLRYCHYQCKLGPIGNCLSISIKVECFHTVWLKISTVSLTALQIVYVFSSKGMHKNVQNITICNNQTMENIKYSLNKEIVVCSHNGTLQCK